MTERTFGGLFDMDAKILTLFSWFCFPKREGGPNPVSPFIPGSHDYIGSHYYDIIYYILITTCIALKLSIIMPC